MDKLIRIKQWVFIITFLVIASTLFIGLVEGALWAAYKITGLQRFSVLNQAKGYPQYPWQVVKVAVFGESAANGNNAERSFADVIDYELRTQFQDKKFYLRNFALNGVPFHGHQSEIIKAVI